MMKKYLLLIILCFFTCGLFGCANKIDNISSTDKIKITRYNLLNETESQDIIIDAKDHIKHICENLNSLTLKKLEYSKVSELKYTLVFYNNEKELQVISITTKGLIAYNRYDYRIEKGVLDLEYIDTLFNNNQNTNEIEDVIIQAYKEKYKITVELEIEKIYATYEKDEKEVIAFMIGNYGDAVFWSETVAGIFFYYADHRRIEVYYDNNIYTLQEAYDNNLLTVDNLKEIHATKNQSSLIYCHMNRHSWDEGMLIPVPGGGYDMLFTCRVCGETKCESVNNGKTYLLTVIGATEYLKKDITGEYAPTSLITVSTQIIIDADIEVYANGVKVPIVTEVIDEDTWYFQFDMPSENVVVEIKVVQIKVAQ